MRKKFASRLSGGRPIHASNRAGGFFAPGRIRVWMPALLLIMGGAGRGAQPDAGGAIEPTVTEEESRRIHAAIETAASDPETAIRMLATEDPSTLNPAMLYVLGNLHFQHDDLDNAAAAYEQALERMPRFRNARLNLGRVYLLQERADAAIALYRRQVEIGPADAAMLRLLGHALHMEDRPVSAETAYRHALLLQPEDAESMQGLIQALMRQERYVEGRALAAEQLRRDPLNGGLWSLRANAYLLTDQADEAARTIEQARRLGCADAAMLATLGDLLLNRDQPADALRVYEIAFREDTPTFARRLRAIEGFLLSGDSGGAARMIESAEAALAARPDDESPPNRRRLLRLKAEWKRQTDQPVKAMALCETLLRQDPLDGQTLLLLADLLQAADRLEEAVMTCERAARIPGFEADALVQQARIEVARERYDHALALLDAAQAFRDQPHVARYLEQLRRLAETTRQRN